MIIAGKMTKKRRLVAEKLQELVDAGTIRADDVLPGERALSEMLGVSRPTVRAVLNDLESQGVLRSVPNRGRFLVTEKPVEPSGMLCNAVVIVSKHEAIPITPEVAGYNVSFTAGAIEELQGSGVNVFTVDPDSLRGNDCARLIQEQPKGIIWMNVAREFEHGELILDQFVKAGLAVVCMGEEEDHLDRVGPDHEDGSYKIAKHLIDRGCKRVLRVWEITHGKETYPVWLQSRDRGYERAMNEGGLETIPQIHYRAQIGGTNDERFEQRARCMAGYLGEHVRGENPIDAIMAITDGIVPVVARAIRYLGLEPNKDILIGGFDNYGRFVHGLERERVLPVATIDKRNVLVGCELVRMLLARLRGELPQGPQQRWVKGELIWFEESGES